MIVSKGFWEFVALDCIDQQLDVSLGTVSHLENWYFSKIEKNSNRYAFNLKLHHLCWVSLAWILFIPGFLPSINITLFLFPIYFEIVKDNRIIFLNNRKTFVWSWFLNLIEFRFLNLIEFRFLRITQDWLSRWRRFRLDDELAWVKSERPISVDRRTRKSINTASDSQITTERKQINDLLFFRVFNSDSIFAVFFYYRDSFDILRYRNLTREWYKIFFRIFISMAEIFIILIILAWGIIL